MKKQKQLLKIEEKIIAFPLEQEMKNRYLNYAMSVITERALPDARDGLKPVQRRILYAMSELGIKHTQPFKKSARIVGETMGKYHPHGDSAIYDAMARLSQDFNMRLPLVDGQGNFGSLDGDSPAAMRYTEARLSEAGEDMLADISEDTVDFTSNFDESLKEPEVLPSGIPNMLVNGASGIAVGMATNMPPHNLSEIIEACITLIDNPETETSELMRHIQGPDFPTGGVIVGTGGIKEAYTTGRGRITLRGKVTEETKGNGRRKLVISEIPYSVNKLTLIESIAKSVQNGVIEGITDIRDESDRNGIRIVIELNKDAKSETVLEQLYAKTQLQCTYGIINLAVYNKKTSEFTLKELLNIFIAHRRKVIKRRSEYRLNVVSQKLHIVEGLLKALSQIDQIIDIIKTSKTGTIAKTLLIEKMKFSEVQAQAILDTRLQRLTGLEKNSLDKAKTLLSKEKIKLEKILSNAKALDVVIKEELKAIAEKYGEPRKTVIVSNA